MAGRGMHNLKIPKPLPPGLERITPERTLNRIRQLSESFTAKQIVDILNREGCKTGTKNKLNVHRLRRICFNYGIKSYYRRLRKKGKFTVKETAGMLGICTDTAKQWCKAGLLSGYIANDKGEYLFDPPNENNLCKRQGEKLKIRRNNIENSFNDLYEV